MSVQSSSQVKGRCRSPTVLKVELRQSCPMKLSITKNRPMASPCHTFRSGYYISSLSSQGEDAQLETLRCDHRSRGPPNSLQGPNVYQDIVVATYYDYFLATLKGVTQKWFSVLPNISITCFHDMCKRLINQFIASRQERRTNIHLSKIR